jgi:hypothetical protein
MAKRVVCVTLQVPRPRVTTVTATIPDLPDLAPVVSVDGEQVETADGLFG